MLLLRAMWIALLVGSLCPVSGYAQSNGWGLQAPRGTVPAQPRVIWTTDPAHRATVSWTTQQSGASSLHFGLQRADGELSNYSHRMDCRSLVPAFSDHFVHHCRLSDLPAASVVYFTAKTAGQVSPELYFVTAPEDDRPFKLLVGGDSRSDSGQRRAMNRLMAQLVDAEPDILALAHGGDYVQNGRFWSQWTEWLTDHELTITPSGRVLPLIPARGNHEATGRMYDDVLDGPGAEEGRSNYFKTTIGSFDLITLNTNISHAGRQREFLQESLRSSVESSRWIVAHYHRPAYPAVKTPGNALQHWVPLFERFNADLVFESDGHVLKRTVPIRNGALDPSGIVYVGEGGLGVAQRRPETDRWYLSAPGQAEAAHHVQRLTVRPGSLRYEALDPGGRLLDSYERRPRRLSLVNAPDGGGWDFGPQGRLVWPDTGYVPTDAGFDAGVADGGSMQGRSGCTSSGPGTWLPVLLLGLALGLRTRC